jgi:hypothetical protein
MFESLIPGPDYRATIALYKMSLPSSPPHLRRLKNSHEQVISQFSVSSQFSSLSLPIARQSQLHDLQLGLQEPHLLSSRLQGHLRFSPQHNVLLSY